MDKTPSASSTYNTKVLIRTIEDETWGSEEEDGYLGVEINVGDEVIRVSALPNPDYVSTEHRSTSSVGPEILRSFPLNFNFTLPADTKIGSLQGRSSDDAIKEIGQILGITDESKNKFSYWILDVVQETLMKAQTSGISSHNQVITINWFLFILKQIQLTVLSRKDFFIRLEDMLLVAEREMIAKGSENIPNPFEVLSVQGESAYFTFYLPQSTKIPPDNEKLKKSYQRSQDKRKSHRSVKSTLGEEEEMLKLNDAAIPKITGNELLTMTQLLYDIYADRLAYEIIRDIFWEEPIIEVVRISERLLAPKILVPEDEENSVGETPAEFEIPLTLDEILRPGEAAENLPEEEQFRKIQEAELQRSTDHYLQPLANAIDSVYFRKIYPEINGISKFVFVKRKSMNKYRDTYDGKIINTRRQTRSKSRSRKSVERKSTASRKSMKRQSMKRKSMKGKSRAK